MASISLSSQQINDLQADQDDQVLFNEVVATLNDLGHYNRLTNKYQLNLNDHGVCLRDLIRFLRNDGQNFLVRRQMGISNIVDNDLLPIIEQHTLTDDCRIDESGKSLMDKIIRLLVDLTNPTVLHYPDQKIPKDDKYEMNIYIELQAFLFQYKLSFSTRKRFWIVISKFLARILELDPDNRQVEDELMMERIIILIRNVLHIPIISRSNQIDDLNVHDRIVEHISDCGLLDILQFMINSGEYGQYCFHLLEIIFLIFREQNAEFLAKSVGSDRQNVQHQTSSNSTLSNVSRSQYEREIDDREFEEARIRDRKEHEQMLAKFKNDDFTRFKETAFVVKNMKAVSDRDMICYRAYSNPEKAMDFNTNKIAQRRPRNRRPMNESVGNSDSFGAQRIHRSSRQLRSILYDFCSKFLNESYNKFMAEIRSNLSRGTSQEHDETYFFWACQFFMEFNRYQIDIDREQRYQQVYETLSTSMFHYIQTVVDNYMEHLLLKKEFKNELSDWSKRLHQALRSYRELLFSLSYIESLNLPAASKMCYRIKTDIFTEPEYREMLLRLMQAYNEEKMSKAYLRDLIETNHMFLKMLEYHAKISLDFKVKVKKRKSSKRKKKSKNPDDDNDEKKKEENVYSSPDIIWIEIIDDVSEALNSELIAETILDEELLKRLFDPLSDQPVDEQKLSILRMIQKFLREKEVKKAISLYREARNAFAGLDEDNVFGEVGIQIDDEMLALNGILMTEFPVDKQQEKLKPENDDDEPMSDEAEDSVVIQEKKFSIDETLMRYAHPNVVRACRILLKNYRTNSLATNHAIVRMLYRLAVNLKMKPMFYNLNFFIIFEQIMDDPLLKNVNDKNCPHYKSICELVTFSYYIIRSFFKLLSKHPKIASEICFTVNSREAYQMEYGFDNEIVGQMIREKKGSGWSEQQKLELEILYNEYKDKTTKEKDVIDLIQENLIDDSKSRRQIIVQLKKMDILSANDMKKNSYKGPAWSLEELEELNNLYEKFKDNLELEEENVDKQQETILTTMIEKSIVNNDTQPEHESNGGESDSNHEINQSMNCIPKQKRKRFDIIDCILKHLSTSTQRNRRQIIRQLRISKIYDHSARNKSSKIGHEINEHNSSSEEEDYDDESQENSINDDEVVIQYDDDDEDNEQIQPMSTELETVNMNGQPGMVKNSSSSNNEYDSDSDKEKRQTNNDTDFKKDDDNISIKRSKISFKKILLDSDSDMEDVSDITFNHEESSVVLDENNPSTMAKTILSKRKIIESDDENENELFDSELMEKDVKKKRRFFIQDDDDEE
ncbi:protein timeless homolog [Dermatophagoides pteronyssinus]|uniref:protein timeless homolog n=1 Tax=Dermatophagoides pteronyssinus TaxID=6956 RepID=UPI003F66736C